MSKSRFRIAVLAGDGIGVEVMAAALEVVETLAEHVGGMGFDMLPVVGGARAYTETGQALSETAWEDAEAADAILFGAMGLPDVRYPDGTEIQPQLDLRARLDLYAGVRPVRSIPGLPSPLADVRAADIDFTIVREQTEGIFWSYGRGKREGNQVAEDTIRVSRPATERIVDFAQATALKRKGAGRPGKLTLVDKANVLGSMAFMRQIFEERSKRKPELRSEATYIDAAALGLVKKPWDYDVIVTENQFGDILSDIGAALIGGMGFAPSADIGDDHALFQPCHGSAPDIMGTGKANPTAMLLSAAMMLDWLGERHGHAKTSEAARVLEDAVRATYAATGLVPFELGGRAGTAEITKAVKQQITGR
ncbi:MAG: isocitrate/isopropylmalate dehydrogenase family protein [Alphaproteobacteria bacterium]|nr:isocitrate/isopropylmalate dehydrogenase family protein [Alphaproteobacteria bacterium]